ncbi:topoisomerase [Luteimonas marina]|uniref:Topoisomerase n=1 Tax=Luteimonas marina TaxID=488485 RepID=A0A5C5UBL8_9GAMM|nr:topoisomerase [Luteimonas marina]TWT23247.1 topoisomerase [Luteimonas marina]
MDCEVEEIAGSPDAGLPDPFARADGSRIATRADWRCHRQALLRTAEAQVYGWKGPKPDRVTGTIADDRIDVTVSHAGREVSFSADLRLPEGPGPHPAIIVVGGRAGVDDGLLAGEGVARIDFVPTAVGAETGTSRARQGAFFDLYGEQVQGTGTLMAWAWGVSRIIDVVAQAGQGRLRVDAIAVTGCSRYGKGALAAGAFDERVALTIPIESGSGGVPAWRGVVAEGAQPPHSAFGEQPWLGDAFGAFANEVERLSIDQHEVLGLVAPRGLLVLDNPHVDWLGARFGHVSALAGAEIYRALGVAGNLGYHSAVADGTHCAWRSEWDVAARDAIRRHLRKAQADDLPIVAADGKAGSPEASWQWRAPELR